MRHHAASAARNHSSRAGFLIVGGFLCRPGPIEALLLALRSHRHLRGERLWPFSRQDTVTPRRGFGCESDWSLWRGGRVVNNLNLHQMSHRLGDDEVIKHCTCSSCTGGRRGGDDLAVDSVEPSGLGQLVRLHVPVHHGDPGPVETLPECDCAGNADVK